MSKSRLEMSVPHTNSLFGLQSQPFTWSSFYGGGGGGTDWHSVGTNRAPTSLLLCYYQLSSDIGWDFAAYTMFTGCALIWEQRQRYGIS